MPEDDPVRVKQLLEWAAKKALAPKDEPAPEPPPIDPQTRAQLEKWFGLPSYEQLEDEGKDVGAAPPPEPEDYEDASQRKVREQREKALAAVDPAMIAWHRARVERGDTLIKPLPEVKLKLDPTMPFLDASMVERLGMIADPREVEISEELRDDLRDCTPQALLRDLHRVETDFDKQFEVVDLAAEQRMDIVAEVDRAMKADLRLPRLGPSPGVEGRALLAELSALRRIAAKDIPMSPNRRVKE